jgi:hypothetical protein
MDDAICAWLDDHPGALGDPGESEHLATCEACRAEAADIERRLRLALVVREAPVPAALERRVHEAVAARYQRPVRPPAWWVAAPVGAAVIVAILVRVAPSGSGRASSAAITAASDHLPAPVPTAGPSVDTGGAASHVTLAPAASGAPAPNVKIGEVKVSGGIVADAPVVSAGMTAGFRRCYQKGLIEEDPDMAGSATLTAEIDADGEVIAVESSAAGLSTKVIGCITARVRSAQFARPSGGYATVIIPAAFLVGRR